MAAPQEKAAGMSNMLKFFKIIGQLKVRLFGKIQHTFAMFWSLVECKDQSFLNCDALVIVFQKYLYNYVDW